MWIAQYMNTETNNKADALKNIDTTENPNELILEIGISLQICRRKMENKPNGKETGKNLFTEHRARIHLRNHIADITICWPPSTLA